MSNQQEGKDQSPRKIEKLDVESEQERQERLGSLFASMTRPEEGKETQDLLREKTRPHAVPQSDARARAFLPQLAASNELLLARAAEDPSSVSIENPTGSHVAMDLGVGVFDVKGTGGVPGDVPVVEGEAWTKGESSSSDSDSSSDSESSGDSDSDEEGEEEGDVQIEEAKTTRKE